LLQWYQHIRFQFISDEFPKQLYEGVLEKLNHAIKERIKRLEDFISKSSEFQLASEKLKKQSQLLAQQWPEIKNRLCSYQESDDENPLKNMFIKTIHISKNTHKNNYLKTIKRLTSEEKDLGSQWLQGIVDQVVNEITDKIKV